MKCKCSSCNAILLIDNDQLRKLDKPVFKCPKCTQVIQIAASKAQCGKCSSGFSYHAYKYNEPIALMKCPNCKSTNRIKL